MNRKFFGDTRDLFKYDLVRHIMKSVPELTNFTFVPMLTAGAGVRKSAAKSDMKKAHRAGRAGSQNIALVRQMERLQEIDDDIAYFSGIRDYFTHEKISVEIIGDTLFSHKERARYFQNLYTGLPKSSLIFLDPDTGLEESSPSDKHLLFEEVEQVYSHMDTKSILMIYQHFPRVKREGYVRRRSRQLEKLLGACPVTITDNEIVFFLVAKSSRVRSQIETVIGRYADTYPVLTSCSDA